MSPQIHLFANILRSQILAHSAHMLPASEQVRSLVPSLESEGLKTEWLHCSVLS